MWQMICKTDSGHAKVFIEQVEQENASYFGNQRRENKKKKNVNGVTIVADFRDDSPESESMCSFL